MELQGVLGWFVDFYFEYVLYFVFSYFYLYCGKKCEVFIKVDFYFMEEKF